MVTSSQPSLSALVEGLQRGGPSAREHFFEEVFRKSYGFALSLYRDEDRAKDAAQEVSANLFEKYVLKDKLSAHRNVDALVLTMTKNDFISHYRRTRRRRDLSLDDFHSEEDPSWAPAATHEESSFMADDLYGHHCAGAPHEQLWRMGLEGYKYRELSVMFDKKINTVKGHVRLAREAMKEGFAAEERRLVRRYG